MTKRILTQIVLSLTVAMGMVGGAFCTQTEQPNPYTPTLRALAANRSLLANCETEYETLKEQLIQQPENNFSRQLANLDYKIKALREDREKLMQVLPTDLQSYELMKDLLVEKVRSPKPLAPKKNQASISENLQIEARNTYPATVALHQKALQLVAEDNLKEVVKIYEQIVLLDPDDDEAYILMGHSYFLMGEYVKAELAYHNAVSINPENRREIAPFYENFILQNPSDDTAYTNLGYAYLMLGDISKARDAFKDALSIQPDNQNAQAGLRKIANQ